MRLSVAIAALATLITPVLGVGEWGQCGGINYTGSKTCDSGLVCVYINDLPEGTTSSSTRATSTSSTRSSSSTSAPRLALLVPRLHPQARRLPVVDLAATEPNSSTLESSAEFGQTKWPGVLGTDYTWPSPSSVDYFMGKGMNTFRIAFLMERMSPISTGLSGSFDSTYLNGLKTIVNYITNKGGYAILDPHNFARYNNAIITPSQFQTWWKNMASEFSSNANVIFDLNNEPHDMSASDAAALMQAGINGVRASGAKQLILVEGTSWSGAWTWVSSGNGDASSPLPIRPTTLRLRCISILTRTAGTSATCVSSTIGVERLTAATNWLKANNLKGFLGEIGAGSNDACIAAVKGALCHLQQQVEPGLAPSGGLLDHGGE
ncbi:Endo-beta-1,4-glucanase B Short=Endoglucanase B; AltName: Full=Carboxymethylcellulase B; AltName: Full=Cellulase B; Flags: Precursor [Serendipita indica DSM 11827]|nr:Endo-beta-1,4-glucanase B Short=Endoglucanase B; AltName: Full=Carboxymethylcellulase B; AltName: Full=Cellulase B; Flags: Precursor [Serendipita indica DSM 11827]